MSDEKERAVLESNVHNANELASLPARGDETRPVWYEQLKYQFGTPMSTQDIVRDWYRDDVIERRKTKGTKGAKGI